MPGLPVRRRLHVGDRSSSDGRAARAGWRGCRTAGPPSGRGGYRLRRRALRGGPAEADRDGGRGLAGLRCELRDATWRQAEGGPPDVDGGDDVATRVVDGRGDRVEAQLVLADRGRVAAP